MNKADRYADRFTVLSVAGTGGTACVYKAFDDETQRVVALKVFATERFDPDIVAEFWNREVASLRSLQHRAVAEFIGAGRDPASKQRFIALEWIDGIALEDHLDKAGKLRWEQFHESIGKEILAALVHAAERNISHRDLSTRNVLITPAGSVKIIDFGQAKIADTQIGRTVAGWRTAPYCPPEDDTGTYTLTRDPFSFSAISVRACCGYQLKDHEALYRAFDEIDLPDQIRNVLARALSRDPRNRFSNSIEFQVALATTLAPSAKEQETEFIIPLRLTPGVVDRVQLSDLHDETELGATEVLIQELNDTVGVSPAPIDSPNAETRLAIETQSYRMVVDINLANPDHLVVVWLVPKKFRLDTLYQGERWMPQIRFSSTLPRRQDDKQAAREAIKYLYRGLEEFQASRSKPRGMQAAIADWSRLLDALRHIARHEVPALRYSDVECEGRWLTVTVENPNDAEEGQIRTISIEGRWVFRGEIDSIHGNRCLLVSNRPRIDVETIPSKGTLEIDWQQTKVALDRQARAVERFKNGDVPSPSLGRLLTGEEKGSDEPTFFPISSFLDAGLDAAKKEIVSRCATGIDLVVTHGPPGTGKTKLIVELIRQALRGSPDCKILLVSQTHAALDNALERLLRFDPEVPCVRIGSGAKEIDARVAKCTVESRGRVLQGQVEAASRRFLEARAKALGVDQSEVELGLRAFDVLGLQDDLSANRVKKADLENELAQLVAAGKTGTTTEQSKRKLRQEVVDDNLDRVDAQIQVAEAELGVARQRLCDLGTEGRALAQSSEPELRQWAEVLLADEKHRKLGDLLQLAEDWRLRFGQSDDFKAAIISSSAIVAGTCVGFCREEAASRTTFDLCIIDEAGKATTTELLVPLAQSRRAVIVGDHHQLPAVIDHAIHEPELMEHFELSHQQIEVQLFEELTRTLGAASLAALTVQYRMRGAIGSLISTCFYDGKLETDESLSRRKVADLSLAGVKTSVTWIDPYSGQGADRFEQRVGTSFASAREVHCVVSLLRKLAFIFEHSIKSQEWPSIAVITGYAPQANQLRTEIRRDAALDKLAVECATVHAFQGREVDICIYSVARRNREHRIGMLSDWRHLNVALSRARDFLVIIGDIKFCRNVPDPNPFRAIVEFIASAADCTVKEWSDD
jgi:serine/threonine protein kinase